MNYCWQSLSELPSGLDPTLTSIDVSHNDLKDLASLSQLKELRTIIADDNQISCQLRLPKLPKLENLSLNKNKVNDIEQLCHELAQQAPALEFLSLHGNPCVPDNIFNHIEQLGGGGGGGCASEFTDDQDWVRYRLLVVHLLPGLKFLDSRPLSNAERQEASIRGRFLLKVRLADAADTGDIRQAEAGDALYSPLPTSLVRQADGAKDKAAFGKSRYIYYGKHSEGNRFIRNNDL